ncbi:hypothetical protein CDD83_1338 [Cordyceps sp. RAO-2017]|nr:hypothetical protein CDD83_1338 [Cordyceps sp. RAO-2017]
MPVQQGMEACSRSPGLPGREAPSAGALRQGSHSAACAARAPIRRPPSILAHPPRQPSVLGHETPSLAQRAAKRFVSASLPSHESLLSTRHPGFARDRSLRPLLRAAWQHHDDAFISRLQSGSDSEAVGARHAPARRTHMDSRASSPSLYWPLGCAGPTRHAPFAASKRSRLLPQAEGTSQGDHLAPCSGRDTAASLDSLACCAAWLDVGCTACRPGPGSGSVESVHPIGDDARVAGAGHWSRL